ncbi:MAG: 50S ribosomal protein L30 [Candidatus ainarchaeum sp.]|nr:50S ribosomal protein L30 [Candidatus ainarchaeum sp.]
MNDGKAIAIVRVRGTTGVSPEVRDGMAFLGLTRVNHCVVVRRTPSVSGTLDAVKDYVTWGEVDAGTLAQMIERKGRLEGDRKVSDAYVKASGFASFAALSEKVVSGEAELSSVRGMKKPFRLHPPRKGYRSVKRKFPSGALGNRGAEIGELLKRMI